MPRRKGWTPPPEGLHMCKDMDAVANKAVFALSKKTHYEITASSLHGTSDARLWKLHCCARHFDRFRNLVPYKRPEKKYRARTPPVENEIYYCPHINLEEIRIKYYPSGVFTIKMMDSKHHTRYVIRGARHSRVSRELWRYVVCLSCYMMFRELIDKPMPLSYGFDEPEKGRWSGYMYGVVVPPWPLPGKKGINYCRDCLMKTLHDGKKCLFLLHGRTGRHGGYPFFAYCRTCKKRAMLVDMKCRTCGGIWSP